MYSAVSSVCWKWFTPKSKENDMAKLCKIGIFSVCLCGLLSPWVTMVVKGKHLVAVAVCFIAASYLLLSPLSHLIAHLFHKETRALGCSWELNRRGQNPVISKWATTSLLPFQQASKMQTTRQFVRRQKSVVFLQPSLFNFIFVSHAKIWMSSGGLLKSFWMKAKAFLLLGYLLKWISTQTEDAEPSCT